MSVVSQKVDARNEIGWTGFVRAANKWLVNSATGWILAPIWAIPEAFTTDVNDVQGQFPVVYNTDRMPYAAVSNTQYYYNNTVVGGTITTTATPISIGKGVVSEEGGYILLDIKPLPWYYSLFTPTSTPLFWNSTWQVKDTHPSFTLYKEAVVTVYYNPELEKAWFLPVWIFACGVAFTTAWLTNPEIGFDAATEFSDALYTDNAVAQVYYRVSWTVVLPAWTYTPRIMWYMSNTSAFVNYVPHSYFNLSYSY